MARMGVWALVWFSGNIPINFLAARSGKRSAEHTLAGRNRIFIASFSAGYHLEYSGYSRFKWTTDIINHWIPLGLGQCGTIGS